MPSKLADLRQALRRLAEWPPTELPVISAYLDLRPQATGQNPQLRSGLVVLRDRLRDVERGLEAHTPAHDSLVADVARIDDYIEQQALPAAQGLAVFACHGADQRFEALDTAQPLDNEVDAGARPRLLPLARLADGDETVVALADTSTLRLFGLRSGALEEIGLLDDEPDDYRRADVGGWSQARFQRHVEAHREAFAQLAASAIEDVAQREGARRIVLAGDEVITPLLTEELPAQIAERARGVLRIDMRASLEEVEQEALAFLEAVAAEEARDAADRLVGAARADGMAVGGADATLAALRLGQVGELLVDPAAEFDADALEDMIRLAATTDARIRFCHEHGGLRQLGGVGGLLRFRLDRPVSGAQSDDHAEGATVSR